MGYSSDENSDDSSTDSIDIPVIKPPKIKFLPATVAELSKRFNELFIEFIRQKKHEHRNELVFLLDELLRQEAIDRDEYNTLNGLLAESLKKDHKDTIMEVEYDIPNKGENITDGEEVDAAVVMKADSDEEVNELKNVINLTLESTISHDKKDLVELLTEIKDEAEEEYLDLVLELEGLVDIFLQDEFLENEPVLPKLDKILKNLQDSNITKSKQQRLKMLLYDIDNNRYRVNSILRRLNNSQDDIKNVLKRLIREELISEEQFKKLNNLEGKFDLPAVVLVIKDTKVGRGLKFLPKK